MAVKSICQIDGCDKSARVGGRGWCGMHYMRWYQHGDPNTCVFAKGESLKYLKEVAAKFMGEECLVWPFDRSSQGYGRVRIGGRRIAAHRVVCKIVHGDAPSSAHDAAHSCGNGHGGCVNPNHVRWATRQENCHDKIIHGTIARGERNGNSQITENVAKEILRLRGTMTQKNIAQTLGTTRSTVRDIHIGKTWAWV